MLPATFYSSEHDGNRFVPSGVHYHSGWDVNRWPVGTLVPTPCEGDVVASGWDPEYGWFVTWRCVHGLLCSRSHMQKRGAPVDTHLEVGDPVGRLGSTGSFSTGPHVHCGQSSSKFPWEGVREDPRPHILAHRTATAGTGGVPITSGDDMPKLIKQTKKNVAQYYRVDIPTEVLAISAAEASAYNKVNGFDEAVEASDEGLAGFRRQAAAVKAGLVTDVATALAAGIVVQAPTIDASVLADSIAQRIPKPDMTPVLTALAALPTKVVDAIRAIWVK